jgi:hypothetical protein
VALSVNRGVYKNVSVATPQSVGGSEVSAGAVNLTLDSVLANFTLLASASVVSEAGGLASPVFPWWLPQFIANETAKRRARKEALARYIDAYAIVPAPAADAQIWHRGPPIGAINATLPRAFAVGNATHLHVVEAMYFAEPLTEEEAQIEAAARLLLAA